MISSIMALTRILISALFLFAIVNSPAYADVPMYLVIVYTKYAFWWAIPLAIAVEAFAIRWIFSLSYIRAAVYSIAVNAVTAIIGIAVYKDIAWMLIPSETIMQTSSFQLIEIISLIIVFDTAVELVILRYAFNLDILGKNGWYFLLANVVTTALIFLVVSM